MQAWMLSYIWPVHLTSTFDQYSTLCSFGWCTICFKAKKYQVIKCYKMKNREKFHVKLLNIKNILKVSFIILFSKGKQLSILIHKNTFWIWYNIIIFEWKFPPQHPSFTFIYFVKLKESCLKWIDFQYWNFDAITLSISTPGLFSSKL